jgi:hypothetical protein
MPQAKRSSLGRLRLSRSKRVTVADLLTRDDICGLIGDLNRNGAEYRAVLAIAVKRDNDVEVLTANCDRVDAVYLMEYVKLHIMDGDMLGNDEDKGKADNATH